MNIDANAHYGINPRRRQNLRLHQDAAHFARANQQIIGPTQIDGESGDGANGLGGGQSGSQWKQRQANSGNRRAQQHACVKSIARRRIPRVIAATAPGPLLIGKPDRAVRRCPAGRSLRIGIR